MANILIWIVVVVLSCSSAVYAQIPVQPPSPEMPAGDTPTVRPSNVESDQPATPVTDVPSPAAPEHATEQAMWSLVGMLLLQHLKRTPWFPLLGEASSGRVKAVWGFALAVITAAGINFSITGSIADTDGATITFSGVSLNAFKDIAWQWASQQGWYQLLVKEVGTAAVVRKKLITIDKPKPRDDEAEAYPA